MKNHTPVRLFYSLVATDKRALKGTPVTPKLEVELPLYQDEKEKVGQASSLLES